MRFIITLITSLILLIPASGQGQWEIEELVIDPIYSPRDGWLPIGLFDVRFVNRDKGFICGGACGFHVSDGVLFETEDGGKTWNLINDNIQYITSIHFVNESKGFALDNSGMGGTITSSDGGYSWTADYTLKDASDIFFLNDTLGWACGSIYGSDNVFYVTIDEGENWNEVNGHLGKVNSLFFIDEESGWAVGELGLIAKYTLNDGWVRLPIRTDLPLNKVFFVDQNNGWISGGYHSDDDFRTIFMRTVDGGENWTQNTEMNYLIKDLHFDTKNHGWAVGEDKVGYGVILETKNGGIGWDRLNDRVIPALNALHISGGVGWAVGDDRLILKNESIDTGINDDNKLTSGNEPFFQNYPNPFHLKTIINYQLPAASDVELSIYDLSGRKVVTLVNEIQQPDRYEVHWSAGGMNPGIYFCELKTGQGRQVVKMIIID